MLSRGDLAGTYFKFSEIARFKDSKDRMESIVRLLGYTPSSHTDNLEAVTGLKAVEIRDTEITVSWQESRRASEYDVYYKKHNSGEWLSAGRVSETQKRITGLENSSFYDFKIIAVSGQVKAKEATLTDVKTTNPTPALTPKPTPTATPKPTPTATPKPTATASVVTGFTYK